MAVASWSWSDIRQGLATNLETIDGLRVHAELVDAPNPPCVLIGPRTIDYHGTMGPGVSMIPFTVVLLAGASTERVAQITLDKYLDPAGANSIRAAVESDKTLGGAASDVILEGVDEGSYGRIAWAGIDWWGCVFTGRVVAA